MRIVKASPLSQDEPLAGATNTPAVPQMLRHHSVAIDADCECRKGAVSADARQDVASGLCPKNLKLGRGIYPAGLRASSSQAR